MGMLLKIHVCYEERILFQRLQVVPTDEEWHALDEQ
jgi:hypothetical protein